MQLSDDDFSNIVKYLAEHYQPPDNYDGAPVDDHHRRIVDQCRHDYYAADHQLARAYLNLARTSIRRDDINQRSALLDLCTAGYVTIAAFDAYIAARRAASHRVR